MITRNDAKPSKDVELKGLSTDTKPTDVNLVGVNSLFLELDTGDFYYFDGEEWHKMTSSGGGGGGGTDLLCCTITFTTDEVEETECSTTDIIGFGKLYVDGRVLKYAPENVSISSTSSLTYSFPYTYINQGGTEYLNLFVLMWDDISSDLSNMVNCSFEEVDIGGDTNYSIKITDETKDSSFTVKLHASNGGGGAQ